MQKRLHISHKQAIIMLKNHILLMALCVSKLTH
nr:MAG TPA: hypothetical protein [Caudoviricetes sp.]